MVVSQVEEYLQKIIIDEIFCNNIIFEKKTRNIVVNDEIQVVKIKPHEKQEPYIDYSDLLNDDEIKNTKPTTDIISEILSKIVSEIVLNENEILEINEGNKITEPIVNNEIELIDELVDSDGKPDIILLIVSLGRTGSTTLCNLLNLIPNTNICGENNNAIFKLLQFYQNLKDIKSNIPLSSNYNTYSLKVMKHNIKNIIITMLKNKETTNLWGFKEIRWAEDFKMLDVFIELFPETKIIINVRDDIIKQSKSAYWGEIPTALQDLKEQTKALQTYYHNNIQRCFKISLEEFYDMSIMKALYSFIEKEQNFNEEIILSKLKQIKKSYERQPYLHIHTFYPAKFKFIHVPKTGGSAVEQFIKPYSNTIIGFGHDNICKDNEYPVIIIRFPIDRFISMYNYWKYGSVSGNFKRDDNWIKKFKSFTIKDFISLFENKSYKTLYSGFTWDQHFLPYSEWLDKESYSKTIAIIYESNLQEKMYKLLEYMKPPIIKYNRQLEQINVSFKEEVKLDNNDIEWITDKYKEDFDLWNKLHMNPKLFRRVF